MSKPHRRLGELLIEAGLLAPDQLAEVLQAQAGTSQRLGALLVERGLIDPVKLTQVLSHQLSLPWVSLAHVDFSPELLGRIPKELVRRYSVVPVYIRQREGREVLYVATDDPTDDDMFAECVEHAGAEVRLMVASPDDIRHALDVYFRRTGQPPPPPNAPTGAVMLAAAASPPNPPKPPARGGPPSEVAELSWDDVEMVGTEDSQPPGESSDPAIILVVHADAQLVADCRKVAAGLSARIEESDMMMAATDVAKHRPLIVVVPEEVYAFDRLSFNKLAIRSRAHLVIWSDEIDAEYLEPLLVAAGGARPGRSVV